MYWTFLYAFKTKLIIWQPNDPYDRSQSINQILQTAFQILTYEKARTLIVHYHSFIIVYDRRRNQNYWALLYLVLMKLTRIFEVIKSAYWKSMVKCMLVYLSNLYSHIRYLIDRSFGLSKWMYKLVLTKLNRTNSWRS